MSAKTLNLADIVRRDVGAASIDAMEHFADGGEMVAADRTLEQIAADIVRKDQQVGLGLISIGNDLLEAKGKLEHGKWGEWLDLNVGYSERKAQMCMQIARRYGSNPQLVADLGIRKVTALMLLPAGEDAEFLETHDVLTQGVPSWLPNLIRPTRLAGVAILPASMDLILDDVRAIHEQRIRITAIRELVELLAEEDAADYVLIDSPPGFTAATTCALAAADDVIIPMRPDAFSIAGVGELMRQVCGMREINPRLRIAGVLVTQLRHTTVAKETVDALAQSSIPMFSATIRSATAIERSTFERRPVRDLTGLYAKQAAEDYAAAVDEWLKGGAGNG